MVPLSLLRKTLLSAGGARPGPAQRQADEGAGAQCALCSEQEEGSCRGTAPLRLLERSVFSDRMVFVRAVHEARWMDDMELAVYDSWCAHAPVLSMIGLGLHKPQLPQTVTATR
jgi:hypothetical protein